MMEWHSDPSPSRVESKLPSLEPLTEYRTRRQRFLTEFEQRQKSQRMLGNARLLCGILFAAVGGAALGPGWISAWWLLAPLAPLAAMAFLHPARDRALRRAARGAAYYDRGLARLENRWPGAGSAGGRHRPAEHLYAEDLDLFGKGSLFDLLSTARTLTGERTLAGWLLTPGTAADVRERQRSVDDMRTRIDLREDMALLGEDIRAAVDDHGLAAWGQQPPARFFPGAPIVALLLAVVAASTLIAWASGYTTLRPFLYVALVEILFGLAVRKPMIQVTASVNTPAHELGVMAGLLERLESEQFTAPGLVALRERLKAQGLRATRQIHRLQLLVERMEWAHNQVFAVIGAVLLWIPQFAMAIERWRIQCGPHLARWVEAVGELEAIGSLAAFAYERPDAVFPELLPSAEPLYDAGGLVHPLIPPAEAAANDVALGGAARLWIVSGSNMSGKSTLMRAIGLSVALAWAGAPVTAQRLRLTRLHVGASLVTTDSLADHRSRFYAEIGRLKSIVDRAKAGDPVLFLLDELLSGTNSHDRRIGAEALLRSLLENNAIGCATTHDLALAEIAAGFGERAVNVHFEDHMEDGQIRFDYRLRPGVIARGNALELMRAVGLDV